MSDEAYNPADEEYANATKLVDRASKREALLKSYSTTSKSFATADDLVSGADFSNLNLKPDHAARPCWTCPDGAIYLEAFHSLYNSAYDFLVAIAEPVARPEFLHEYKLTPYSLYAAVATNIETESIIRVLDRLSKNSLPPSVAKFIRECTKQYGKAKLVLKHNKFFIESEYPEVLRELLRDSKISQARVVEDSSAIGDSSDANVDKDGFVINEKQAEMEENLKILRGVEDEDSEDEEDEATQSLLEDTAAAANSSRKKVSRKTFAFQIQGDQCEIVKKQAIEMDYPLMEEYDFRNDTLNPNVPMDLKPHAKIRRYQERSLAKMFGNGRARSGIIVLPCGAGKTLTGVTAAQTIKKSVICLCTNAVSVLQWKYQFQLWTNIPGMFFCLGKICFCIIFFSHLFQLYR